MPEQSEQMFGNQQRFYRRSCKIKDASEQIQHLDQQTKAHMMITPRTSTSPSSLHSLCRFFAFLFILFLSFSQPLFADGPGVPNRIYPDEFVLTAISQLNSANGAPRSHGHVSMHKGYLVVVYSTDDGGSDGGFSFYDISDPYAPELVFQKDDEETREIREAHGYGYSSSYAGDLVALQAAYGVQIWDWTDIFNPVRLSYLHLPGIEDSDYALGAWWLSWQAPYIYIGGSGNGIYIVDATDPQSPFLVQRPNGLPNPIPISQTGGFRIGPIFAVGNLLAASSMDGAGYVTMDISDPKNPIVLDVLSGNIPDIYSSLVNGYKILATGLDKNLYVYDIRNPSTISLINSADIDGPGGYVTFQDGFAHVGASIQYTKVDIRNDALYDRVGKATSGIRGRDEDFVVPLGNLIVLSDDHGFGSFIIPHKSGRDLTGPSVNMVIPMDGATNQAQTTRVGLTFTDFVDLRSVNSSTFIVRPVGGVAISGKYSTQFGIVNFFPDEPLEPLTTYEVVVPKNGMKDLVGNLVPSSFVSTFTTAAPQIPLSCQITFSAPAMVGALAIFHARGGGGQGNHSYSWDFGDGSLATSFSPDTAASHIYNQPGHYSVRVTVSDGFNSSSAAIIQTIHHPLTNTPPAGSSQIIFDAAQNTVWNVNPDNETVAAIDASTFNKKFEVNVGKEPGTLAKAPDGAIWVVVQGEATIKVLDGVTGAILNTISLPYASRPYGIVFSPDEQSAFVTLQATGGLAKLSPITRGIIAIVNAGPTPRSIAMSAASDRIFITRFISPDDHGEVVEVNPFSLNIVQTFNLALDPGPDTEDKGRGIPNYLGSPTISPDGRRLWIPSKKDNIVRGLQRDGLALDFESTVRTIVSQIDLLSNAEDLGSRRDLNNRDMAVAVCFSSLGDYAFVAAQGSNTIDVFDTYNNSLVTSIENAGHAPQGLALSSDGAKLFVHSFLSRAVLVYDVSNIVSSASSSFQQLAEVQTASTELLHPIVFEGKRIFYNAKDPRMSQDGYLSCASCHLDGNHDGRTWDFTDRGEGFRNTTSLLGRRGVGQGRVHWTANFDEIQDFENDIRFAFGGEGFLSDADFNAGTRSQPLGDSKAGLSLPLDALAAYVSSLIAVHPSPYRNVDGSLTTDGQAGQILFQQLNCSTCHAGNDFTDSQSGALHDVGTIKPTSGMRIGQPLTGIDTPTLRGLWETAPYLHDGSAATIMDVLTTSNNNNFHGFTSLLSETERQQLVAYLYQIDNLEPAAPEAIAPLVITSPANNTSVLINTPVSLSVEVAPRVGLISKVVYRANDIEIGETFSVPYGFTWNSAQAGNYTIKADAHYTNGKTAQSSSISISIIDVASIAIITPVNNANFTMGQPVMIDAQTSSGSNTINKVEFFADTNLLGEDNAAPYSFTWNNAAVGTHILAARIVFADSSFLNSTPVTISVSSLPVPVIAIPANNQKFAIGDTVQISVNLAVGNNNLTKIELFADSLLLGEDGTEPYEFLWNGIPLGSHTLAARAVYQDSIIVQSTPVAISAFFPATIAITSPAMNQAFIMGNSIRITVDATAGPNEISKIEFYSDAAKIGEDADPPYEFTWHNALPGVHVLVAKSIFVDATTLSSEPVTITITQTTDIEERFQLVGDYALSNAYPNPFNPTAQVKLIVARAQHVRLEIFNMLGQRAGVMYDSELAANRVYIFTIDARSLSSGNYFYRANGEAFSAARNFTISK